MAQSRLEKIGTVYSRTISLLKGKAIKEEDKPLWLAIYESFPPKYEPRFDRRLPKKPIIPIYYEEDSVRARFHKDQSFIPATNIAKENINSSTQNFISIYNTIKKQEKLSEDVIYERAMQQYTLELETQRELRKGENKLSTF